MELESNDKNLEPIQYSEEFRRAKRSALAWAGIVLLLALGTIRTGSDDSQSSIIEVGSLARNLAYSQPVLIILASVVLIFMLAGFWRANARLGRFHSKFALARKLQDVSVLADQLAESLRTSSTEIGAVIDAAAQEKEQLESRYPALEKRLQDQLELNYSGLASQVNDQIEADLEPVWQSADRAAAIQAIRQAVLTVLQRQQHGNGAYVASDVEQATRAGNETVVRARENSKSWQDAQAAELESATKLSSNLERFSADLISGERRWHRWHDVAPVIAMAAIALVAAGLRLTAPDVLEGWVAPVAHQSPGTQSAPPSSSVGPPAETPAS